VIHLALRALVPRATTVFPALAVTSPTPGLVPNRVGVRSHLAGHAKCATAAVPRAQGPPRTTASAALPILSSPAMVSVSRPARLVLSPMAENVHLAMALVLPAPELLPPNALLAMKVTLM
jgi:hypothetical protein